MTIPRSDFELDYVGVLFDTGLLNDTFVVHVAAKPTRTVRIRVAA